MIKEGNWQVTENADDMLGILKEYLHIFSMNLEEPKNQISKVSEMKFSTQ